MAAATKTGRTTHTTGDRRSAQPSPRGQYSPPHPRAGSRSRALPAEDRDGPRGRGDVGMSVRGGSEGAGRTWASGSCPTATSGGTSGCGTLAAALLARFPRAEVLASESARGTRERWAAFPGRAHVRPAGGHRGLGRGPAPAAALPRAAPPGRQAALLVAAADRAEPGGAPLLADLVEPPDERARRVYSDARDAAVRDKSPPRASAASSRRAGTAPRRRGRSPLPALRPAALAA